MASQTAAARRAAARPASRRRGPPAGPAVATTQPRGRLGERRKPPTSAEQRDVTTSAAPAYGPDCAGPSAEDGSGRPSGGALTRSPVRTTDRAARRPRPEPRSRPRLRRGVRCPGGGPTGPGSASGPPVSRASGAVSGSSSRASAGGVTLSGAGGPAWSRSAPFVRGRRSVRDRHLAAAVLLVHGVEGLELRHGRASVGTGSWRWVGTCWPASSSRAGVERRVASAREGAGDDQPHREQVVDPRPQQRGTTRTGRLVGGLGVSRAHVGVIGRRRPHPYLRSTRLSRRTSGDRAAVLPGHGRVRISAPDVGDEDGVLELGRPPAVLGDDRPAVVPDVVVDACPG